MRSRGIAVRPLTLYGASSDRIPIGLTSPNVAPPHPANPLARRALPVNGDPRSFCPPRHGLSGLLGSCTEIRSYVYSGMSSSGTPAAELPCPKPLERPPMVRRTVARVFGRPTAVVVSAILVVVAAGRIPALAGTHPVPRGKPPSVVGLA